MPELIHSGLLACAIANMLDPILLDLALLFGLCIAVAMVFHRLRMPPMVGFLAAGALVGPNALGLVSHPDLVKQLAELGVVALLFTVGIELSNVQIRRLRRPVMVGGAVQILGTVILGALVAILSGLDWGQAIFIGFLLSLSSTAAITKLLGDRGELNAPSGRMAVAICIAQDLAVVPMILILPLLAGGGGDLLTTLGEVLRSLGLLALTAVGAHLMMPRILDMVSRTRSRELFVLAVITLCLSVAIITAYLGLSLALGALIAGFVLGRSDYQHQAVSEIEPFRDALGSLFFVSIGMLFDYRIVIDAPGMVIISLMAVVFGKMLFAWLAIRTLKMPNWLSIRSGLMLAQVGEFSFVLAQVARGQGLMPSNLEKIFYLVAVLSIAATPALFAWGRLVTRKRGQTASESEAVRKSTELSEHAILIGFGPVGQTVARTLKTLDIPYRVIEMNGMTVKEHKALGEPISFGDATRPMVLKGAGIARARVMVLAINDSGATLRIAAQARRVAPHMHILARATFLEEVADLEQVGVDEIVPQELETSVEITVRTLRRFLVPDDEVGRQVKSIRDLAYGIRKQAPRATPWTFISESVPGLGVKIFKVEEGSEVAGLELRNADLRRRAGLNVIGLKRGKQTFLELAPDSVLMTGDLVVVVGSENRMADAGVLFRSRQIGTD